MNYQNYTPQYITYHKIIDFLQSVQQASPRLNSFGHGDIVYFSQTITGGTAVYPYMFVTPQSISYYENTTQYQISIIFADIVNTDLSNEIDVVSDMSLEARNLLSQIWRGSLFNDIANVELPSLAVPFFEKMNDHIGGVSLDMTITVMEDMNACYEYPTPSPSPVPDCGTIPVYSQVIDFSATPQYNSIVYRCDGTNVQACYSCDNQYNITDLVDLFNTPPPSPLPGCCTTPSYCYCWTDYGTYYDNGDGRIRCEMPYDVYNTLCPNGTLTLDVIYD